MPIHAFVDESIRPGRYQLTAALVKPAHLSQVRRTLRQLRLPGQRTLRFAKEKPDRKRLLADAVARLPVEIRIYAYVGDRRGEALRRRCLELLVSDLLHRQASRLAINSRAHRDTRDAQALRTLLGPRPRATELEYEHVDHSEPLLWVADIAAWCHGAGRGWHEHVEPNMVAVVDVVNADRPADASPRLR